jgi:PAS domain S-box-containing protein
VRKPSKDFTLSNEQVAQELNTRLRQLAAVAELGQSALTTQDLKDFIEETVRVTAEIISADFCGLMELLPQESLLILKAGTGWQETSVGTAKVGIKDVSHAGYTLQVRQPVIVDNMADEKRFTPSDLLKTHKVTSGMSVILPGKVEPFGILAVYTRLPRTFSSHDLNILQSVANILAPAIARHEAETALRLSYEQLMAILQSAADGITVQDPTGRMLFANQAAARVMGFDKVETLLNTPLESILKKFEYLDESGKPFPNGKFPGRLALQGESEPSAVIRYRDNDTGQEFWSLIKSRPVINQNGQIEMAVNVFHDITELKRLEQAENFLAEVSKLLSSSLDYATTLNSIAQMTVRKLADWCAVNVIEEDKAIHQVAVAHANPEKLALVRSLQERFPPNWEALTGTANVLRTGRAEFYPKITDEFLEESVKDGELLQLLRELSLKSAIILPLVAHGQTLGVLTLMWAESGRRYTEAEVTLAEELARRAAYAIDNARLYREEQKLNEDLEARVARRTDQLHSLITTLRDEIDERKLTEEELRRNQAILNSLFDSAPDGQVIVNEAGNIVRANTQVEVLFGYDPGELVGESVEILLPERYMFRHVIHRSFYMDEPRHRPMGLGSELFGKRKDGSEFPVDIMLSSVHTDNENLVIAAIRDITDRKQMEAELAEVQRRLIENIEAERLSLARELHDGPVQDLYGISYQLKAFEDTLENRNSSNPGEDPLSVSQEMVQQVINALRSISGELRPPALAPYGLEKAIQAHIESLRLSYPELQIQLDLMPDGQMLPERVRLALYRIYQHSVSNVLRHAEAKRLRISLSIDAEQVVLEIEDDGRGFDLPARWIKLAREGHLGLVGTSERVRAIGGNLKIKTERGKGTLIQVSVPRGQN